MRIEVVVERGGVVEARHHVLAARWDAGTADPGSSRRRTLLRSAAKPLQAVALAQARPDLTPEQLAAASASHDGGARVTELVTELLHAAGCTAADLRCTADPAARLHHACSGSHAGMLLLAASHGWPAIGYEHGGHPVQALLHDIVAGRLGCAPEELETARDGCGVPSYACTLEQAARAYAELVSDDDPDVRRVAAAMAAHPELIGSPSTPDVRAMRRVPGAVAKHGQEGLLCVGLPGGTGVVLKTLDGSLRPLVPSLGALLGNAALAEEAILDDLRTPAGVIRARVVQDAAGAAA